MKLKRPGFDHLWRYASTAYHRFSTWSVTPFGRHLLRWTRIGISLALLIVLFNLVKPKALLPVLSGLSPKLLILLFVIGFVKQIIENVLWKQYIDMGSEERIPLGQVVRSHFMGQALRLVFPGGTGVLGKVFFVNQSKSTSAVSIIIEKYYQIVFTLFTGLLAGFFFFRWPLSVRLILLLTGALLIPLPGLILGLIDIPRFGTFRSRINRHLPFVTLLSLVFRFLAALQYYLILGDIGGLSFVATLITCPIILASTLLPISIGGLGVRETVAILVLEPYGISPEAAVSTSLIVFIINNVVPAIVGGALLLFAKPVHRRQQ